MLHGAVCMAACGADPSPLAVQQSQTSRLLKIQAAQNQELLWQTELQWKHVAWPKSGSGNGREYSGMQCCSFP